MRIGIVTTWFERGAAYVSRQYCDLLKEEHEVFIYARGGESYAKGDLLWDLPNVTWGKKPYLQTNSSPMRKGDFKRWVTANRLDVVFFNEQHWWPPVLWARDLGVVVGSYVDYYTEETVPLFGAFDFLVCNTKRHLSAFDWHEGAAYVPWGTDTELFKPGTKNEGDADKLVFFNSCGWDPDRKGVRPLLEAFSRLKDQRAKLLLHTQVDPAKHYADLAGTVGKLLSSGRLEIVRETVPAPGLFYRGDVYCYVSKLDGIGLTMAEAGSCGLQMIVPDQPPMNEFVAHGENGLAVRVARRYCRPDGYYWPQCEVAADDLVGALQHYLDRFDEIDVLKANARQHAVENFDWSKQRARLSEVFSGAQRRDIGEKVLKNISAFEFKRMPYWPLLRLPYKTLQNIRR